MNRLDLINKLKQENPGLSTLEIFRLLREEHPQPADKVRDGIDVNGELKATGNPNRF